MIPAYPLHSPKGWPRKTTPEKSRFDTTLAKALSNVRNSLRMFGEDSKIPTKDIVISSNVSLGSENPKDAGVAVWFTWEDKMLCIAVDKYAKVQDNLQAIHHIIESRRTELRHGGLHILRQAFSGFKALPEGTSSNCWEVLGIPKTKKEADIHNRYKEMAKTIHPDAGGSAESFCALQEARDEAIQYAKS